MHYNLISALHKAVRSSDYDAALYYLARMLEDLKDAGFWTVGLSEHGEKPIAKEDYPPKIALIMGAEGAGMRRLTQDKCDFLVHLPTDPAFSTLNVSVAFALALYELSR